MTRERIEDIREIILPFVRKVLLKTNYENLGKSDAEEFTRDFNEILELAIKALEQEPTTKNDLVPRNVVERIIKSPRTKEQMLLVLNSLPSQEPITKVEAIPKADYENRLKADLKAILVELQLEIEEKFNDRPFSYNHHQRTEFYRDIDEIIQQKINSLKENTDGNK
jgi:hypothetical protein